MDDTSPNHAKHGANLLTIFVTSFCAAIVVAGGFGIVFEAFIVAASGLFELGNTTIMVGSFLNVAITLWLFLWCFARSLHVERRLKEGLEVDEPKLSILTNLKGYGPSPAKP
ncbi:MAG TPA: hypothetical protein VJK06_05855 [Methyloceanibacter sp.]|nr:hypothetical protein [Methyloceanibacter sp.]